jgi:hypothetical protein
VVASQTERLQGTALGGWAASIQHPDLPMSARIKSMLGAGEFVSLGRLREVLVDPLGAQEIEVAEEFHQESKPKGAVLNLYEP